MQLNLPFKLRNLNILFDRLRAVIIQKQKKYRFRRNLMLLNDVLNKTSFHSKYFVAYGLLLGWAREKDILDHDYLDADFGYFKENREFFFKAFADLENAGFKLARTWINNAGENVEYVFFKDGARFEFFELTKENGNLSRLFGFAHNNSGGFDELVYSVPCLDDLSTMKFLNRIWLKPTDHDSFLRAVYGNWLIPNKNYKYAFDDLSIVKKYACEKKEPFVLTGVKGFY
jgi:hypothetical protein